VLTFLALVKVQSKYPVTQSDKPDFLFNLLIFRMADFQDKDILHLRENFEYDFGGDDLGPSDQEEPLEQGYNSDVYILEEEESADPVDLEEQNLFGCGGMDIFRTSLELFRLINLVQA